MKRMKNMKSLGGWLRARRPIQLVFMSFMTFMVPYVLVAQTPVFKTKVEVVQLDISVLDKHRQPVRGLTQKDFTILEDGKPQPIVGFATFDVDNAEAPVTGWMRDVAPDVATNSFKESRLFVIVMDDALIPQDPFAIQSAKKVALSIIDKLSADDLTAVVFTGDNRKTQDFTGDKNKLRTAVDKFNPGLAGYRFGSDAPPTPQGQPPSGPPVDTDLWFYQSSARTLENVAQFLGDIPNRRKAVFWVSPGVPMDLAGAVPRDRYGDPLAGTGGLIWDAGHEIWLRKLPPTEMVDLNQATQRVFQNAQRANVTIYPIDPTGLGGLQNYLAARLGPTNAGLATHKAIVQQDYLAAAAANTGGRTIMNTNEFETGIKEVFAENESYYLIGFEPVNAAADGKLRRIEVNVNRPDVDVRTRSSYYAPEPPKPDKKPDKKALPAETVALQKAMAGILPMAGMPMRASVASFAVPGQRLSTVAIVLGITQPIPEAASKGRVTEKTELLTSAFTPEGDPKGTQKHTASVVLGAGSTGDASYEVLARIDLPPGRYQLRLAAHNSTSNRDGSVFTDVTVPDYSNVPFSASPIVLGATPGRKSAPRDLLTPLLPFVPTAEREFARSDKVTAFLRLYQSGQKPIEGVQVSMQVRDAGNQVVARHTPAIGLNQFKGVERATESVQAPMGGTIGTTGSVPPGSIVVRPKGLPAAGPQPDDKFANMALVTADVKYPIPVDELKAGAYLLTIEATLGATTIRRDIRFVVR